MANILKRVLSLRDIRQAASLPTKPDDDDDTTMLMQDSDVDADAEEMPSSVPNFEDVGIMDPTAILEE